MTLAYFDCFAGASGDMLLGSLVDAGWPIEALADVVVALGLDAVVDVTAERVMRGPLAATRVHVQTHELDAPDRRLGDILAILETSRLPGDVSTGAATVFRRLAEAEAAVHGVSVEAVHFHEVGALDTIVDVAGTIAGLVALGITDVYCSPLPAGSGWTTSLHGPLPLPAPATLALMAAVGAPVASPPGSVDLAGELVTPTGAALLTTLATFQRPAMTLDTVAHGAGGRDTPWPNVLRLWLGSAPVAEGADVVVVETNIDDMAPELYGHVMARLLDAGALDVWLTPIQMKKDRPGTLLSALAPPALEGAIVALMLAETTTLGVRVQPARRHVTGRAVRQVDTPYGPLAVKLKIEAGRVIGYAPEYEPARAAAVAHGVPLARVYTAVLTAAAQAEAAGAFADAIDIVSVPAAPDRSESP